MEHQSGRSRLESENAHYSCTTRYILLKVCLLIHFNIVWTLVHKTHAHFTSVGIVCLFFVFMNIIYFVDYIRVYVMANVYVYLTH